ncbi:20843_t:CDS:10 [Rhizophagus irregularis]|uniref:Skm1p n=2 Tax=Rhizophagus irregularis TaxID=588596 RepID=A0A015I2K2_RHIIW|nr:Skm1p [Rhizophagus irregularis DAOM 197198w]CAG8504900.1 20843_t:CDS:10 [Rhizophagus irregularis]
MSTIELEGEAKEQYTVINDYNYGSELNVYKAYKKDDPECHYVIKSYKTKETFERESQMLRELHDTKNIVQIVDVYLSQSIIVCECALYDLETFLVHQDHIQRQEKIDSIIKDIISGLSELQKHNIVHTALAPKNIMYFQEKDGYTESWKLIDFSAACFVGSYYSYNAKIKLNYSAPEVIIANEKKIKIKVDFTMDMFSFGLILYFLETGHHYWDGVSEEKKEEILSTKYLPLRIHDPNACCVIKSLLSKNISRRMPLDKFMRTPYYTGESTNLSDYEINEEASQSNSTSVSRPNSTSLSRPNSTYLSPLRISNISNLSQDSFVAENWNYSKFDIKNLTDPLDSYHALEYVFKVLGEVIENVVGSGRKHFRKDDIMEIAQKMRGHLKSFKHQNWDNNDQKVKFISILKNQVHLYNRFLWLVVRYCAVKDRVVNSSLAKKTSILCRDILEINSIIKAGKSFNSHLSKLIMALKDQNNDKIQSELSNFAEDPCLDVRFDDDSNITLSLSRWYCVTSQIYSDYIGTPSTEIEVRGEIFVTKKLFFNDIFATGKSLNYLNYKTFLCIIKEISFYNDHQLNDNDFIIRFHGYSIQHCKCNLFYDCADYGDLFEYFQNNHNSSEHFYLSKWINKIKLAWGISIGVKYLHNQKIVHLDLRSENILLKYDEKEETLMPKISNFLWSREIYSGKTSAYPIITLSSGEEVWKRWYDPDRLRNKKRYDFLPPSDIYSLGLLFWEIAWCKPKNLPFKDVPIKNLYNHLTYNNYEKLPEFPDEYQCWGFLINGMWKLKAEDRCNIMTVELSMGKLFKGTDSP